MEIMCNNWCRLCGKDSVGEVDIYSTQNSGSLNLEELISTYLPITLNSEDITPKKICIECYNFIERLFKFIECVKETNKMFYEILSKNDFIKACDDDFQEQYDDNNHDQTVKSEFVDEDEYIEHSDQLLQREHVNVSIKVENIDPEPVKEFNELPNSLSSNNKSEEKQNKGKTLLKSTKSILNKNELNSIKYENNSTENSERIEEPVKQKDIKFTSVTSEKKSTQSKRGRKPRAEERSECKICNRIFSRRYVLKEHIKTIHNEPIYECKVCHKKFGSERSLKFHGDAHLPDEQKYACPYCDKKFTKSVNIKPHIRTVHLGEKAFVCEECGKAFGTKGNLMDHLYTHKTEALFKCSQCDKEFKNKSGLRVHEDTHSDTVYICPQCGVQLKTRKTLNKHMLVHSDEKKHKCEHCGMAFKRSGHLKRHLISHIGLKLFSCKFCDKAFTNTQNCRLHMSKIHTQELAGLESIGSGLTKIYSDVPSLDQLKAIAAQTILS